MSRSDENSMRFFNLDNENLSYVPDIYVPKYLLTKECTTADT